MRRLTFLLLAASLTVAAGPARQNAAEVFPLPPIPPELQTNSERLSHETLATGATTG